MYRVPMIFPGQASQSVGMARDLADGTGPAARFLGEVDGILGHGLTGLMYEGPLETLTETRHAQPAILAHSVAAALALRELGVEPSVVAGHSLGEYSAAVAAGALAPGDGLRVVRRRGELMFEAGEERPGTMAAVMGLSRAEVEAVCARVADTAGVVCVANHNSESQIAISGEIAAVRAAGEALTAAGAKRVIQLQVSGAFHSPLLADAARQFGAFLAGIELKDPGVPLVANVTAAAVRTAADLRDGLDRQLTAPVLWQDSITAIATGAVTGEEPRVVLEVGPGKVLSNLARRTFPGVRFVPVGTAADLDNILDILGEVLT
jgi:[acyl-carrier-protein] S-malonyltransferase